MLAWREISISLIVKQAATVWEIPFDSGIPAGEEKRRATTIEASASATSSAGTISIKTNSLVLLLNELRSQKNANGQTNVSSSME